jgi:hypothetical protein
MTITRHTGVNVHACYASALRSAPFDLAGLTPGDHAEMGGAWLTSEQQPYLFVTSSLAAALFVNVSCG